MLTFFSAIAQHLYRLMAFRHDGSGLPTSKGPALYALMVIWVLTSLLETAVTPTASWAVSGLSMVLCLVAMNAALRPIPQSFVWLAGTFFHLVAAALNIAGVYGGAVDWGLTIWCCACLFHAIRNHAAREHAARPANRTRN